MAYTYSKLIKDLEKKVNAADKEVHAVKWMFYNSDFFCGYSHLNDEANAEIVKKRRYRLLRITNRSAYRKQLICHSRLLYRTPFRASSFVFYSIPIRILSVFKK